MSDYIKQITQLEQTIQNNKLELAKLQERQKTLQEDKEKLNISLKELGVTEAELEKRIATLDAELEEEINKCKEQLNG